MFSANFWWNFVRISRQIPEKSDVCRFFNHICENKLENFRKFWNLWKLINYSIIIELLFNIIQSSLFSQSSFQTDPNSILFNIIQYYSILFIRVLTRASRPWGARALASLALRPHQRYPWPHRRPPRPDPATGGRSPSSSAPRPSCRTCRSRAPAPERNFFKLTSIHLLL